MVHHVRLEDPCSVASPLTVAIGSSLVYRLEMIQQSFQERACRMSLVYVSLYTI